MTVDFPIYDLPRASEITASDLFVLQQGDDAKSLTGQVLLNKLAAALAGQGGTGWDIYGMVAPNAGAHNSIYRGKFLGNNVTAAQYAAIAAGTFDDLFIGDYWIINNVMYLIAAFDYYLFCGDISLTTHHAVIFPSSDLYQAKMNDGNTTDGGYVGSKMRIEGLDQAKTIIKSAFNGHVLSHRVYLSNGVTNGSPSSYVWCDSEVELMNERMIYGCSIFTVCNSGTRIPANYDVEKSQLPLFAHRPDMISYRMTCWLRDIVSNSTFASTRYTGDATWSNASNNRGVRPIFCIS